jgi:hypothetical protein
MHPNPPRLITVVVALALIVIGISATIFPIDIVGELVAWVQTYTGTNLELTREIGWLCLLAGDALLVIGSLLPGI